MRRWILILVAGLVAYGSLYPFGVSPPESLTQALRAFVTDRRLWTSTSDVVGNVALFVPLGAAALISRPRDRRCATSLAILLVQCVGFAFALQVAQIYVSTRLASLADVFWNTVGVALGMLAGIALERFVKIGSTQIRGNAWVVTCIVAAWMVAELAPFVPSLDFYGLKQNLKPLLLHPEIKWVSALYYCASALVIGRMLQSVVDDRQADRALLGLTLIAIGIKMFGVAQALTPHFLLGLVGGYALHRLVSSVPRRPYDAVLLSTLAVLFIAHSLAPYELRDVPARFGWLPFSGSLEGGMLSNARSLGGIVFAIGAMLWLVGEMRGRVLGFAFALTLVVAALEYAQTWVVGRTGDITTPFVALIMGVVLNRASHFGGGGSHALGETHSRGAQARYTQDRRSG